MNTSEELYGAAEAIEEHGWAQGFGSMAVDGPHCLLGAIGRVTGAETLVSGTYPEGVYRYAAVGATRAAAAVAAYLDLSADDKIQIAVWNDTHTRAEVLEVLRAAAVIEAAKEAGADLPADLAAVGVAATGEAVAS